MNNDNINSPLKVLLGLLIAVICLGIIGFCVVNIPAKSIKRDIQLVPIETETEAQVQQGNN